jgi:hypothetical protein
LSSGGGGGEPQLSQAEAGVLVQVLAEARPPLSPQFPMAPRTKSPAIRSCHPTP